MDIAWNCSWLLLFGIVRKQVAQTAHVKTHRAKAPRQARRHVQKHVMSISGIRVMGTEEAQSRGECLEVDPRPTRCVARQVLVLISSEDVCLFSLLFPFFSFCRGQKACCGVAFLFPTRRLVICKGDAPIPLPSVPKSDKSLTAVPDGGKGRGENRGWCAGLIARGLLRQVASLSAVRGEEGCDAMGG